MIGYTSRTGTLTTLAALRTAGWRLLVTPVEPHTEGMPYALDNGAWAARDGRRVWDEAAFGRMFDALGAGFATSRAAPATPAFSVPRPARELYSRRTLRYPPAAEPPASYHSTVHCPALGVGVAHGP